MRSSKGTGKGYELGKWIKWCPNKLMGHYVLHVKKAELTMQECVFDKRGLSWSAPKLFAACSR